ncbi:MAG: hypothetical protein ACOZB0_01875 [Pseudomonadota bacterium]
MSGYALFQGLQMLLRLWVYSLLGQGLLAWLAGPGYRDNAIWRLFNGVTWPVRRLTRALLPARVPDRMIGPFAVLFLLGLNLALYMLFHSQGWLAA